MPCAVCGQWVNSESVVYQIVQQSQLSQSQYTLHKLDGSWHCSAQSLDGNVLSVTLAARAYRIHVREDQRVVHVCGEWLRWRLCEMVPPPETLQFVWYPPYGRVMGFCWFFVCEGCRDAGRYHENYTSLNIEGAEATASEDED